MERLNDYEPPVRMDAKHDALDTMWAFLQMGGQKADIPALKEYCGIFRRMMIQKTAGQRNNKSDISFAQLDTICNAIVIESMSLYLSGELDRLEGSDCDAFNQRIDDAIEKIMRSEDDSDFIGGCKP